MPADSDYTDVLTIDPEFASICPPQSEEELALLKESLIAEGGRNQPGLYWENDPDGNHPLIDGHTSYKICLDYELDFPTKGMRFDNRDEVIRWICRNQLGRRNVTGTKRDALLARLYEQRVKPVGNPNCITVTQLENPAEFDDFGFFDDDEPQPQSTAAAVAEEAGVSPATVNRAVKNELSMKALRHRAPEVAAAVAKANIGPTAIKALSVAPEATLQALAPLQGKALKSAVREILRPAPTVVKDLSLLDKLDEAIKTVKVAADEAGKAYPSEYLAVVNININRCKEAAKKWRATCLENPN